MVINGFKIQLLIFKREDTLSYIICSDDRNDGYSNAFTEVEGRRALPSVVSEARDPKATTGGLPEDKKPGISAIKSENFG